MRNFLTLTSASVLLVATASAQAPDVIHYNFDAGDATNSATGPLGAGTPNGAVTFGAGPCSNGAATSAGGSMIDSGWQVDLGTSSFTIGMTIDLSGGGNAFQYYFGSSSTGGMRCFGNGAAGVDGLMLRTLAGADVVLANVPNAAPAHCVWSYDSVLQQVDGYVDGVLNTTVAMPNPINYVGTLPDFNVMTYTTTSMVAGNTMDDFRVYRRALSAAEVASWAGECGGGGGIGTNYCGPAVANSTGNSGVMSATGSATAADNDLTLVASDLLVRLLRDEPDPGLCPDAGRKLGQPVPRRCGWSLRRSGPDPELWRHGRHLAPRRPHHAPDAHGPHRGHGWRRLELPALAP